MPSSSILSQIGQHLDENSNKPSAAGRRIMDDIEEEIFDASETKAEWQVNYYMNTRPTSSVLLFGPSGTGKTTLVKKAARAGNLRIKTFNTPTMDIFAELVGIPDVDVHAETKQKTLNFVRQHHLNEVDVIFLDEINRIDKEKQNALFELVLSREINGVPLPNLKMVWAAMNTQTEDDSRAVTDLDDAFRGRWKAFIHVPADPRVHHYTISGISERVARAICRWWHKQIKPDPIKSELITPRILEFIGQGIQGALDDLAAGKINDLQFDWIVESLAKHNELASRDSKHYSTPISLAGLLAILHEQEEFALKELANNSPSIDDILEEVRNDPRRSKQIAVTLAEAIRKKASQAAALIKVSELRNYSKVLTAIAREDGIKIFVRPNVAEYFYRANHNNSLTPEEMDIFKRYEKDINSAALAQGTDEKLKSRR